MKLIGVSKQKVVNSPHPLARILNEIFFLSSQSCVFFAGSWTILWSQEINFDVFEKFLQFFSSCCLHCCWRCCLFVYLSMVIAKLFIRNKYLKRNCFSCRVARRSIGESEPDRQTAGRRHIIARLVPRFYFKHLHESSKRSQIDEGNFRLINSFPDGHLSMQSSPKIIESVCLAKKFLSWTLNGRWFLLLCWGCLRARSSR